MVKRQSERCVKVATNVAIHKGYEYWITCHSPRGKYQRPFYGWVIVRESGISELLGGARSLNEAIEAVKKTINILEAIKL